MRIRKDTLIGSIITPMVLVSLLLLSLYGGYLFFHSLAELFSIIVAYLAFVVAGYAYRYSHNHFLMFLGIVLFWTGSLDLMHTLTYKGVEIFPGLSANTTGQYWITARFLSSLSFLISPIFFRHRLPVVATFLFYGLITAVLAWMISSGLFPDAYIEGEGLTAFKINGEYVIIGILLVTLGIFIHQRHYIEREIFWSMAAVLVLTMISEVVFTLYMSLYGLTLIIGHIVKFFAFWMLFQAMVRTTLMKPFSVMARTTETYDAIPEPTVLVDEQGIIQQINSSTRYASGRSLQDIVGQRVHELFHDTELDESYCGICANIRALRPLRRSEVRHGDVWYRISLAPVTVSGVAVGMVHVAHDITERKLTLEALRTSEEQFRQLAENINEVFWLTEPVNNTVIYVSPAFEKIWGMSMSEVYRRPMAFIDAVHPDDVDDVIAAMKKQVSGGYDELYRVVRPDGSLRWIRDRAFPVRDETGQVYRIAGIATDMTQQLEAEDARRSNQAKTEFLSRMSHELRTPLTAVLGFSQLLETEKLTEEQQSFVEEIHRAGEHLLVLVNDVLDLSRIESGKLKVELEVVSLGDVVRESISMVNAMAKQYSITLVNKIATENDTQVRADETRLKQVIVNLLTNGIKYNHPQGEVVLSLQSLEDGRIQLLVTDTGLGMTAEELNRVFEPFVRLRPNQGVDGVGIGLTLTRYLLQLMGGEIQAESEPGTGSVFRVILNPA